MTDICTPFLVVSSIPSIPVDPSLKVEQPQIEVEMEIDQPELCQFLVHNVSAGDLSRLREIMMSQLDLMAIDIVEMYVNSSALPDETIVHRLGLVPILCETIDDFVGVDECECEEKGCNECSIPFTMEVYGNPLTKTAITSDDIVLDDVRCVVLPGNRFPLLYLREGEHVRLDGKIMKGNGRLHSKWSPVSCVVFKKVENDTFRFSFESTGLLTNGDILEQALKVFYA
uniref:RPB3 subunit of eukaryotic RNA polymerase II n=1 Tax=Pithovirus LCPAC304 TaxID=2506594 RepID=A0A481ZAW2_9VIRU|nr:MAG: RPB3 subunit of eukaryotic RNA polymerase II [Pithovirus LCPAC304]